MTTTAERVRTFTCSVCGQEKTHQSDFTTGYGRDADNRKVCYACCADQDRAWMIEKGKITLYLTEREHYHPKVKQYKVTNWPDSLIFDCTYVRKGQHNLARTRYDAWFNGPDGYVWHGVTYGDNTQICHCRRTKKIVRQ